MYTLISKFYNTHEEVGDRLNYTLLDTISGKTYIVWEEQLDELITLDIPIDNYTSRKKLKEFALVLITTDGQPEEREEREVFIDSVTKVEHRRAIKFSTDNLYSRQVEDVYEKYIAGCRLIGKNNEFKYIIKDKYVVMTEYLGDQKTFVVPEFIDAMSSLAGRSLRNTYLILQEGIQFIGVDKVNIESIPKSVKLFSIDNQRQPNIISDNTIQIPHRNRRL